MDDPIRIYTKARAVIAGLPADARQVVLDAARDWATARSALCRALEARIEGDVESSLRVDRRAHSRLCELLGLPGPGEIDAPDDGAGGSTCPACGSVWGDPVLGDADAYHTKTRAQFARYLDSADFRREINERAEEMLEAVLLPAAEVEIAGRRYECERAWMFSCPLCNGESSTDVIFIGDEVPAGGDDHE